ncbi:hypothetical protein EON65_11855 [archaeon]|nr:MAG: hypothetical protein EON65_11855 [archaeon]
MWIEWKIDILIDGLLKRKLPMGPSALHLLFLSSNVDTSLNYPSTFQTQHNQTKLKVGHRAANFYMENCQKEVPSERSQEFKIILVLFIEPRADSQQQETREIEIKQEHFISSVILLIIWSSMQQ